MDAIKQMIDSYNPESPEDAFMALKEIMQNIALLGLYRSNFFSSAAFYGGTALRILYGLDRFSEDMYFSLLKCDSMFSLDKHCLSLEKEIKGLGFEVSVSVKKNIGQVKSAFLKSGSVVQEITFMPHNDYFNSIKKELKIKIEVDTQPPGDFTLESKIVYKPTLFTVTSFDKPSLFAGKVHAALFRRWKNRVKGRDWYDLLWYIGNKTPVNLKHLKARMVQTGDFDCQDNLPPAILKEIFHKKFDEIDFKEAANEVLPFIKNPTSLELWDSNLFHAAIEDLLVV